MNTKNMISMKKIGLLLFVGVLVCCLGVAPLFAAAKYPSRPVELIVPFAPGGAVDVGARAFAPALEAELGNTVVIVNKPGAGSILGMNYVISAKNDGYTIFFGGLHSAVQNHVLGSFEPDPREVFVPLGAFGFDTAMIAVAKDAPFNTLDELVAYAKQHPNELSYGITGRASIDSVLCYELMRAGDVQINMVNFDGGSEIMAAIMGGHIQVMGGLFSEVVSHYNEGEVKILGVGAKMADAPELKTFSEQGYALTLTGAKRAMFIQPGTSQEVLDVLIPAIKRAAESEEMKERFKTIGMERAYTSPEDCKVEIENLMEMYLAIKERLGSLQ